MNQLVIYSGNEDKKHIIKYFRSKEKLEAESRFLAEDDWIIVAILVCIQVLIQICLLKIRKMIQTQKGIKLVLTVPVFTGEEIDALRELKFQLINCGIVILLF
jgi:hypothetical protein